MPIIFRASDVPVFIKHVTLAIMAKPIPAFTKAHPLVPPSIGEEIGRFLRSFILAVNGMRQQGFLTGTSKAGVGHVISLTGKGAIKNRIHLMEDSSKSARFDGLFTAAFAKKATKPEGPQDSKDTATLAKPAHVENKRPAPSVTKTTKPENPPPKTKPKKATTSTLQKRSVKKMPTVKRKRPPKGRV